MMFIFINICIILLIYMNRLHEYRQNRKTTSLSTTFVEDLQYIYVF